MESQLTTFSFATARSISDTRVSVPSVGLYSSTIRSSADAHCLASASAVGNATVPRTQATITIQLSQLAQLHDHACALQDTIAAAQSSGNLLQTRDVRPLTFEAYEDVFEDVVTYIDELEDGLASATTSAIGDLVGSFEREAQRAAADRAALWQTKVDEDQQGMQIR